MSRHHEHQHFFQCGRHALNNLCGEEWATTVLLTAVAEDLVASQGGGGKDDFSFLICSRLCNVG